MLARRATDRYIVVQIVVLFAKCVWVDDVVSVIVDHLEDHTQLWRGSQRVPGLEAHDQ